MIYYVYLVHAVLHADLQKQLTKTHFQDPPFGPPFCHFFAVIWVLLSALSWNSVVDYIGSLSDTAFHAFP